MKISFFSGVNSTPLYTKDILHAFYNIQSGEYQEQLKKYWNAINNNPELSKELKTSLPSFTPSGTFSDKREGSNIVEYSGIIHLDYDDLSKDQLASLKDFFSREDYVLSCFVSPSQNGLKVFFQTDSTKENHKQTFNELRTHYDDLTEITSDSTVCDLARLCFVSYDSDIYINEDSKIYLIGTFPKFNTGIQNSSGINDVWDYTCNVSFFKPKNRNNHIHLFACNANKRGFSRDEVIDYACSYASIDFNKKEIEDVIVGVYRRNIDEHGSLSLTSLTSFNDASLNHESIHDHSPQIPDFVYEKMPDIIRSSCALFEGRERDVIFTGLVSVLGAALTNTWGLYFRKRTYTNLFSFVIAPAASGKGAMNYAKEIAMCYHETLKLEPNSKKVFFIPANISASKFISHLDSNNGKGILFESEADTLTSALKQEWGSFSDILRKGFHHETVGLSRRANDEYVEVNSPKFGICLSGTPDQFTRLISSQEDGLFSRFLYYNFDSNFVWKDAFENNNEDLSSHFSLINEEVCKILLNASEKQIKLTENQSDIFKKTFSRLTEELESYQTIRTSDILSRLGIIAFKLMMIFTSLRKDGEELYCDDIDFETCLYLTSEIFLKHSLSMANKLSTGKYTNGSPLEQFYSHLPNEFNRDELAKLEREFMITSRTISNRINVLISNNRLMRVSRGAYKKI